MSSAEDVPDLLRALSSADEDERHAAVGELFTNIFHQGSRYGAAAATVPFLLALASDPDAPERIWPLHLTAALAIGYDEAHLPSGVDITAWREEVARLRETDPAAEAQRLDAWVAEASNEHGPSARSPNCRPRAGGGAICWRSSALGACPPSTTSAAGTPVSPEPGRTSH